MQSVPKRVFTHEYRAEAVKLVLAEGLGATASSTQIGFVDQDLFEVDPRCAVRQACQRGYASRAAGDGFAG